jgi:hypothetical protein
MSDYCACFADDIKIHPLFSNLFPIDREVQKRITESMKASGFDASTPVIVWRQTNILIDGHARRIAALKSGVQLSVSFRDFADEKQALTYAIECQRNRRNITDQEIDRLVGLVDMPKRHGGDRRSLDAKNIKRSPDPLKSADETAKAIGTSPVKVKKVRAIHKHAEQTGDTSERDAVATGQKSINAAYNATRTKQSSESNGHHKQKRQRRPANKTLFDAELDDEEKENAQNYAEVTMAYMEDCVISSPPIWRNRVIELLIDKAASLQNRFRGRNSTEE